MIEFTILGSGSGGNATLIRSAGGLLLVDAGLSASQLVARLQVAGVNPADLHGIILTHEHGDHTGGLAVFTRKYRIPVLANAQTREVLRENVPIPGLWKTIPCGGQFQFAGFEIETFRVPHDAVDPMGFILRAGGVSLGLLSDLGHATTLVLSKMQALDALFVEANYDAVMLANDTKRPWSTRQRIASRHGHLSNDQAAEIVQRAASRSLQRIVLGHLSRDCNSPDAARARVQAALAAAGCAGTPVDCACQNTPTAWYSVLCSTPVLTPAQSPAKSFRWEQTELF
jgi:phosphoribosyl 1,2-cyclic phosphodiesterase